MTDQFVQIADSIVPEIFEGYTFNAIEERSALIKSGIITSHSDVNVGANLTKGGHIVSIPFWNEFSGRSQEYTEDRISVNKIGSGVDAAVCHFRANAWGSHDFASIKAGSDPMLALANHLADYWTRDDQITLVNTITGAVGAFGDEKILDISGLVADAAKISDGAVIDTIYKMGDAAGRISAIAMHSHVAAYLVKQKLAEKWTETLPNGEKLTYTTYLGKRIIEDDTMPVSGIGVDRIFTTVLFGQGAVCFKHGSVKNPIETDRDSLGSKDILISRRAYVMHIRGIKWNLATCANGTTPSDAEMSAVESWTPVYDHKKIRLAVLKHKI